MWQVSLVYANVSPDDILLKQKLDILATSHPNFKVSIFHSRSNSYQYWKYGMLNVLGIILQVFYTVDNPSKDWRGGVGYVSKDVVSKGLPGPGDDSLILVR